MVAGKRIFCSNRHPRHGCGRTIRLYMDTVIPAMKYLTSRVTQFLASLCQGQSIQQAYESATRTEQGRHAYRWLNKLDQKLADYRCVFHQPKLAPEAFQSRCPRLRRLLTTTQALISLWPDNVCQGFQLAQQKRFI